MHSCKRAERPHYAIDFSLVVELREGFVVFCCMSTSDVSVGFEITWAQSPVSISPRIFSPFSQDLFVVGFICTVDVNYACRK